MKQQTTPFVRKNIINHIVCDDGSGMTKNRHTVVLATQFFSQIPMFILRRLLSHTPTAYTPSSNTRKTGAWMNKDWFGEQNLTCLCMNDNDIVIWWELCHYTRISRAQAVFRAKENKWFYYMTSYGSNQHLFRISGAQEPYVTYKQHTQFMWFGKPSPHLSFRPNSKLKTNNK